LKIGYYSEILDIQSSAIRKDNVLSRFLFGASVTDAAGLHQQYFAVIKKEEEK